MVALGQLWRTSQRARLEPFVVRPGVLCTRSAAAMRSKHDGDRIADVAQTRAGNSLENMAHVERTEVFALPTMDDAAMACLTPSAALPFSLELIPGSRTRPRAFCDYREHSVPVVRLA
jgi:hypothetical protein